jgi:TetR/AcrR family transcriptional regulator
MVVTLRPVVTTNSHPDECDALVDGSTVTGPGAKILAAGRILIATKGTDFTTHDVVQEADVALQTFYRYFASKDLLLLALIGDLIREHCENLAATVQGCTDPVERLERYVYATLAPLQTPDQLTSARFITSEHWRLHHAHPAEVWAATQPFTDLLQAEIAAGAADRSLSPRNPERDAWLMTKTLIGAYHHHAFQPDDPAVATLASDVWSYCLAALGGHRGSEQSD